MAIGDFANSRWFVWVLVAVFAAAAALVTVLASQRWVSSPATSGQAQAPAQGPNPSAEQL